MQNQTAIKMPGTKALPSGTSRTVRSTMDTVLVTQSGVEQWKLPPFQRPLKQNTKVLAVAEHIKAGGGIIPGVITIGVLKGEKYVVDGQHRIFAFKLSAMVEGIADVRMCYFDSMAEMGEEFVNLNSVVAKMTPDDILRGLEGTMPELVSIRSTCPFIAYGNVRRNPGGPMLSMSTALRAWFGGCAEVPSSSILPARELPARLTQQETANLCEFYKSVFAAWGVDNEYSRMWGALNLTILAWLWRRVVLTTQPG